MNGINIFYISIGFFVLTLLFFFIYFIYSQMFKINNSCALSKKNFMKKILKTTTKTEKFKPAEFSFFSPRMGRNKLYFENQEKDNDNRKSWLIRGKLSKINFDEVLNGKKFRLYFRISNFSSNSKSIWNITNGIEEVLGSSYIFLRKRRINLMFNFLTFLLSAYGALWPIMASISLNYGIKSILSDSYDYNVLVSSILLLSSILSGILSISIRQIFVYKEFLKINNKLSLSINEMKSIRRIIFSKIFFSIGMVIFLPIDFIKEFSQSWLLYLIISPFFVLAGLFSINIGL